MSQDNFYSVDRMHQYFPGACNLFWVSDSKQWLKKKKRFYLFIHERHGERGRDIGRGRSRLLVGSPMQNSIPGPLSQRAQPLSHPGTPDFFLMGTGNDWSGGKNSHNFCDLSHWPTPKINAFSTGIQNHRSTPSPTYRNRFPPVSSWGAKWQIQKSGGLRKGRRDEAMTVKYPLPGSIYGLCTFHEQNP